MKPRRTSRLPRYSFFGFVRDKLYFIILSIFVWGITLLFLFALKVSPEAIILLSVLGVTFVIITLSIEYARRRAFYRTLAQNLQSLDQAYLILETLHRPGFYDGKFFYDVLYQINKSMSENVKKYQTITRDFQEYIEMWIHEVKTPLATLALISRNPQVNEQIKRIDDYVEQILYLARAENAERDYLIKPVDLSNPISAVANRNRELLQARNITFSVRDIDYIVHTDAKWLEFILNQIIANSIKYGSTNIQIFATQTRRDVTLHILDNGAGISAGDLPRVFDKSFTGSNGRTTNQSTGMGLYIVKTLCDKLGHRITINSRLHQYTEVQITFAKNDYFGTVSNLSKK